MPIDFRRVQDIPPGRAILMRRRTAISVKHASGAPWSPTSATHPAFGLRRHPALGRGIRQHRERQGTAAPFEGGG